MANSRMRNMFGMNPIDLLKRHTAKPSKIIDLKRFESFAGGFSVTNFTVAGVAVLFHNGSTMKINQFTLFAGVLSATPCANAAAIAFYTDSGIGVMTTANANNWGTSNKTNSSVIFEVFIDYTSTVADATSPFSLFELGADAVGSGIAISGSDIIFAMGGGSVANTATAIGPHGLTAGQTGVQILAALEINGGTGTNELLSLYVNGFLVATADSPTGNDWAGLNNSNLGSSDSFNIFEFVPSLNPNAGNNANGVFAGTYPDPAATITFAAYELGVGDNTVANLLVPIPEPGSLTLLGLGGLLLVRRRSRA